jgi:hypothetical protein
VHLWLTIKQSQKNFDQLTYGNIAMNRTIHTFFIVTTLLANSGLLFGMQRYSFDGKKPSLYLPTGNWEDADREEVIRQIALEREATAQKRTIAQKDTPTITITNTGNIAFTVQTDAWSCFVPAHKTAPTKPCTYETFLEILTEIKIDGKNETKTGHCLIEAALSFSNPSISTKELAIKLLTSSNADDVYAVINNSLAIPLEDAPPKIATHSRSNSLDNESDTTETTQPIAIDSPVTSP